jgi:hypothetical protein
MAAKRAAFVLCMVGAVGAVAFSLLISSVSSQPCSTNARGEEKSIVQLARSVAFLNVSSYDLSTFLTHLGNNQALMSVLSTTSATIMSILVAALSLMRSELNVTAERYDKCHTKHRQLVHAVTYRSPRPEELIILPVGDHGNIGDVHYEWRVDTYRDIREEDAWKPSAAEIFDKRLSFDIPFNFELSDSVLPEEEPTKIGDEQLAKLAEQMRPGVAYVRIWRHFRDGTLKIQSSFLTRYPSIIRNIQIMLSRLITGILLFDLSLIFSIAWIVSLQPLLSVVSLLAYCAGLCVITRVVVGFRSYVLRTR